MTTLHRDLDSHLDMAEMRMIWTIARTLASNAAERGHDVAAFQGFALTARRLAVSNAGTCLVRVVILYGGAAKRALRGIPWEPEDELEAFVVTMPMPDHADVEPFESSPRDELDDDASRSCDSPHRADLSDSRWLSQPVGCTSRIDPTGMTSRDPVAARPGGVRSQVSPAGESAPRWGAVLPWRGLPRV